MKETDWNKNLEFLDQGLGWLSCELCKIYPRQGLALVEYDAFGEIVPFLVCYPNDERIRVAPKKEMHGWIRIMQKNSDSWMCSKIYADKKKLINSTSDKGLIVKVVWEE